MPKCSAVDAVIARRIAREPVARILGEQEFYGLPFLLSADTLVPRPETEMLVDEAQRLISADDAAHILDLGTGTGCILLSILHARRKATGLGVDVAAGAVATAQRNAHRRLVMPGLISPAGPASCTATGLRPSRAV